MITIKMGIKEILCDSVELNSTKVNQTNTHPVSALPKAPTLNFAEIQQNPQSAGLNKVACILQYCGKCDKKQS